NALPYLLSAIEYQVPTSRQWVLRMENKVSVVVPPSLRSRLHSLAAGQGERRGEVAEFGFRVLGPTASPAVPHLAGLLYHTNAETREKAMDALARVGIEGFTPLATVLTNYLYPGRGRAAFSVAALCRSTTNVGYAAIPVLVQALKDKDEI